MVLPAVDLKTVKKFLGKNHVTALDWPGNSPDLNPIENLWAKMKDLDSRESERLRTHLKNHTRYDQGPEIHGGPRRVSLPVGEAQLDGCLKVCLGGPLEWDARISDYAQGVVQDTVDKTSVIAGIPDWCTVFSC